MDWDLLAAAVCAPTLIAGVVSIVIVSWVGYRRREQRRRALRRRHWREL